MLARSTPICMFLPSLDGGGAERVFVQLANEFAALGFRVHLLLATARGPYLKEVAGAVRIVDLGARGVLHSLPRFVRYLRAERPSVVLSALDHSNIIALLACAIARTGARCIISMRAVPSAIYRQDKTAARWIFPMLMRMSYRLAAGVIANAQAVAADLVDNFKVPASKVTIIYNPLDLVLIERLSRENAANTWLDSSSVPLILGVGSLTVVKDFPTLIRAFAIVRSRQPCRLAILGEGGDRAELEALIASLGLQTDTYMPGFVDNPFAWMRRANVAVCSSLTEGCPNALMQALACGTAVVSTNCAGGCSEILEGGRWGRLVPVGDFHAMADSIAAAMNSGERADVRKRAADFAIGAIAQSYLRQLNPDAVHPIEER